MLDEDDGLSSLRLTNVLGLIICETRNVTRDAAFVAKGEYDFPMWAREQKLKWSPMLSEHEKLFLFHDLRRYGYVAQDLPIVLCHDRLLSEPEFRRHLHSDNIVSIIHQPIWHFAYGITEGGFRPGVSNGGILLPGGLPYTDRWANFVASKLVEYSNDGKTYLDMQEYILWVICDECQIPPNKLYHTLQQLRARGGRGVQHETGIKNETDSMIIIRYVASDEG